MDSWDQRNQPTKIEFFEPAGEWRLTSLCHCRFFVLPLGEQRRCQARLRKSVGFGEMSFLLNLCRPDGPIMSPLPQIVCVAATNWTTQRRRKRFGGEGRVRGIFSHAAVPE